MPAQRITMRRIKEILRLKWACGLTHRQIQGALGVGLGTISQYLQFAAEAGLNWSTAESMDDEVLAHTLRSSPPPSSHKRVEPDYAWVHRERRRQSVTLQLLWEEYVEANPGVLTYRYTQFCQRYRDWANMLKRSMRQTHRAGEKLFADFAGQTVPIFNPNSGIDFQAHIFVAVLGASNYTFACATRSEAMPDWMGALSDAMEFIGGVPALIVPDNPRALIAQPDRYEPVLGRTTADFVRHYATAMLPARPRKPQDKAKVEVGVQIVERWILARLRHQRFFNLAELNKAIGALLEELNQRTLKKLGETRRAWFERLDRPALRPLPAQRYELAKFQHCRVNIDYHVEVDTHYYSVPHTLARQQVDARITQHTVEILHRGKRVAAHVRSHCKGAHTTVAEHMPAAHRAHLEWSPGRLIHWGESMGPNVAALVKHLLTHRPHPEMGYRACLGLLRLARQYDKQRLDAACARAIKIGAPNRRSVLSILKAGLDRHGAPANTPTTWHAHEHENVRGPHYYH